MTDEARKAISGCEELTLDYVNNYLTVEKFAEVHNLPLEIAKSIIRVGIYYNNVRQKELK